MHTQQSKLSDRPYIEHQALYKIEGWPKAHQNLGIYTAEEVGRYLSFFISKWVERGLPGKKEKLKEQFSKLYLHWQQIQFINPENPEVLLVGLTVFRGYKDHIAVFVYDGSQKLDPKIEDTALCHELIHVALLVTQGDMVKNHFNVPRKEWPIRFLDFEEEVNDTFRRQRKR